MKNKGFLFSVLTLLLFLSMIMLAITFRKLDTKTQIGQEKTRAIYDDVKTDYKSLIGLSVDVNDSDSEVVITFNDTIPLANGTQLMSDYKRFIEEEYARELNTNITLTDAENASFNLKPYDLVYGYPNFDKKKIMVRNLTGNASYVSRYELRINSNTPLTANNSTISGGSLQLSLNASFPNRNVYYGGGVDQSGQSNWTFNASGKIVTVRVGLNNIDGEDKASTLIIEADEGLTVDVQIKAILDEAAGGIGLKSNTGVGIRDDISKTDKVWLTPPTRPTTSTTTTSTTSTSTTTTAQPTTTTTTSTTITTTTSTSTTTTSIIVVTCGSFCTALGSYTGGNCILLECNMGEVHETTGDVYCTSPQICCCIPATTTTTTITSTTTTSTTITTTSTTTTSTTVTTTSTTSTTTTSTTVTTTSTTTTLQTCNSNCTAKGYLSGTCRRNQQQCSNNNEDYNAQGDQFCTGGASADTCCCYPKAG